MKNRKSFLAMLSVTGVSLSLAARAEAQPTSSASQALPTSAPASSPASSASATPISAATEAAATPASGATKAPSAEALATARTMRRFDAKLTDAQIETIARGIDGNAIAGARLNPKKKRLRNSDEPVTIFVVRG